MTLNTEKLHDDLLVHCNGTSRKEVCKRIGTSPSIFYNLRNRSDIKSSTLIKILKELGTDLKEYLV